jgi:hypothetical protein
MGIWILSGDLDETRDAAVLVDSVSMRPFGRVFDDADEARDFIRWCRDGGAHYRRGTTLERRRFEDIWLVERTLQRCGTDECPGRAPLGRVRCADCDDAFVDEVRAPKTTGAGCGAAPIPPAAPPLLRSVRDGGNP